MALQILRKESINKILFHWIFDLDKARTKLTRAYRVNRYKLLAF